MPRRTYFVYNLASFSREIYIGVTDNIARRVFEHRNGLHPDSFAHAHATFRLVYAESCGDVRDAIRREKQLKGWRRSRKIELIERMNPGWVDLGEHLG
jgi:putative endonuclease